jgi:dTDP-4-dehydrorhamnose 3,5-epimerase
MRITKTALKPACIIDIEPVGDDRGFFARTFCAEAFARHGLPTAFVQSSLSFNRRRGTLRGLHYQGEPSPEAKLIRCTRGVVFDVMVDLRPQSPTFRRWIAVELSAANARAVYVPPGFAHGFQTLCDDTELYYQMTAAYASELARGVRWNDPAFAIDWPLPGPILSPRDAAWPDFAA